MKIVGQKLCCSANVAFAAFLHFLCVSIAGKIGHFCSPMFHGFCANKPFFQTLNSIFAGNDFLPAMFFSGNVFLLEMFFAGNVFVGNSFFASNDFLFAMIFLQ